MESSSLQQAMTEMQANFLSQMAEFQRSLEQATPSTTVAALAVDFSNFKKFVLASLSNLRRQADILHQQCDRLEMQGRRKMLLVHGVAEAQGEDTSAVVLKLALERLQIPLSTDAMSRSHRMGRPTKTKTRPILVKFRCMADRDKFWFAKTALKGSGITISEFLTKPRHDTFLEARKRVGISKCWTRNGIIVVTAADGSHHRITSMAELTTIVPTASSLAGHQTPAVEASVGVGQDAASTRSRRKK
ncbi:hypothetical protein ABMA27_003981 [Loxostege sticticalis]|uniref:Uncharacterized protein n=1 Tax=Loxostege sticticalis TaxID=481309 RepID=A0ABR3HR36_LOXSC